MNIEQLVAEGRAAGSRGEPLVSAELAEALADAGDPGVQIVLNAAVAKGDAKIVAYCMQLINARLREQGKEV